MKGFDYEFDLRPNYEMTACVIWVIGGLAVFLMYLRLNLPVVVFQVMGFVCFAMAAGRGIPAVKRFLKTRRMKGGNVLEFLPWLDIKKRTARNGNKVWIGTGFPWTQKEIQRATDFLNKATPEMFHRSEGRWLHGLGPRKNRDVEIDTGILQGHTLVVGTTGTGKTRFLDLLIAQAIWRGETVIVIDPKGDPDLREKMKLACERMGASDRYMFFHPAMPKESVRIDPLKNWQETTEVASRVSALIHSETENDPFKNFCWQALNWIVDGMVYLHLQPNLVQLQRYINEGVEELLRAALTKYFDANWPGYKIGKDTKVVAIEYKKRAGGKRVPAIDGLITSYLHDREHFQKMVVSLVPILSMLTAGNLRYLLSPEANDGFESPALDLAALIEKKAVLYVGLNNLSDAAVGSAIGSIMLADLTAAAGEIYVRAQQGLGDPTPVNIIIDEAAEVVNEPAIQILNKGRGAGIQAVIATQTLADLEVRTGTKAGARQVIANTNNWIIFRVIDGETQKYISEALPKTAVKGLDQGYRSATRSDDPVQFSATYTESLKEHDTELLPPALLGMLPNFHYFARIGAKGATWKGKVPILEY